MRLFTIALIMLFTPTILIGCTGSPGQIEGGRLTKEQVLKLNPDADIFEFNGKVYKTGVDWIEEEELTKDEQIGEISEKVAGKLPAERRSLHQKKEMKF